MRIGCAALYPITRYGFPYSFDDYLKASLADMHSAGFEYCELEINVDIDLDEYHQRGGRDHEAAGGLPAEYLGHYRRGPRRFLHQYGHRRSVPEEVSPVVPVRRGGQVRNYVCLRLHAAGDRRRGRYRALFGSASHPGAGAQRLRLEPVLGQRRAAVCQMARTSADFDQKLIIENRVGDFVNTSDGVLKLIEDAGEPNGGCLLDIAHTHATKEHLDLVIPKLKTG